MKDNKDFWDKEYENPEHLALSNEPSEDVKKFCRWIVRTYGERHLNEKSKALDVGCGNGRNLLYVHTEFKLQGVGFDISEEAVRQAKQASQTTPLQFVVRSITDPLPAEDESVDLVIDSMSSHVLRKHEREAYRAELLRVLAPQGLIFFKSFLLDDDAHAKRLLREHKADEEGGYIHPKLGVFEYVWTEEAIHDFFGAYFEICKIEKSHLHRLYGKAFKRRTISVYLEKK